MNAMILAAGRGERMRPLTDTLPKALLMVAGKPLVVWHIEKLAAAGFLRIIINHAHLGALIEAALGNGERFGIEIVYSPETEALETAGGIARALHRLGEAPFAVVNADVYSDFDYRRLADATRSLLPRDRLAHLVLVANPDHHPTGDFALSEDCVIANGALYTFSGMAAYSPAMFGEIAPGAKAKLATLLRAQIAAQRVGGELYAGRWCDVGTPARLASLERELALAPAVRGV